MSTEDLVCADCGTPLKNGHSKCPKCGSGNKLQTLEAKLALHPSDFRARQKNKSMPGDVLAYRYREKIAGESGRPARDELTVDRRDKEWTSVHHKVKELIDGVWKLCDEHTRKYRVKRWQKEVR